MSTAPVTPERLLEICTDEKNTEENWSAILEMCERVTSENHKKMVGYILLRLFHRNPHVSKQAITVLDACMKNCGMEFQNEIVSGAQFRKEAKKNIQNMHAQNRAQLLKTIGQWVGQVKTKESPNELLASISAGSYDKDVRTLEEEEKFKASRQRKTVQQEEQELAEAIAASLQNVRGSGGVTTTQATTAYPTLDNALYHNSSSVGSNANWFRSSAPSHPTTIEPKRVRALYDFEAAEDNELTFKAGELILVLDDSDANWWKGSNQRGEGLFPSSFVTSEEKFDETLRSGQQSIVQTVNDPVQQTITTYQELQVPPRIDEALMDQCLELLGEADPTALDDSSMPDLAALETRCYQMTPLLDVELERIDREHNELMELNRRLIEAMQMYNQLMTSSVNTARMPPMNYPPASVTTTQQMYHPGINGVNNPLAPGSVAYMQSMPPMGTEVSQGQAVMVPPGGGYMQFPPMQQQQQQPQGGWMPLQSTDGGLSNANVSQIPPVNAVGGGYLDSNRQQQPMSMSPGQYPPMQSGYAPQPGDNWVQNPRTY